MKIACVNLNDKNLFKKSLFKRSASLNSSPVSKNSSPLKDLNADIFKSAGKN